MMIILEGPDGAGKTHLAHQLVEHFQARLHHEGPPPKDVRLLEHYGALVMREHARGGNVVFDRLALGELIYGPVLRGEDRLGELGWTVFKRLLTALNVMHVICLPSREVALANWRVKHEAKTDLVQREAQWDIIYMGYSTFARYASVHYSTVYDYTRENSFNHLVNNAVMVDRLQPLKPGIIGTPGGRYLLVGDRGANPQCAVDLPFFSTEGSSLYLHRALIQTELRERDLLFMNAFNAGGQENEIPDISEHGGRIIALGREAGRACKRQGIKQFTEVPHPQWWRRFRHHYIKDYARLIRGE